MEKPEKLLLKVEEAAELSSVSRTVAYELIASGVWPVVRIPGTRSVRVPLVGLRAWIAANMTGNLTDKGMNGYDTT